jgi:hypothetical protein
MSRRARRRGCARCADVPRNSRPPCAASTMAPTPQATTPDPGRRRAAGHVTMTTPPPPVTEPDPSALTCPGDQVGPCATCQRKTQKYGRGGCPLCHGAWRQPWRSAARACGTSTRAPDQHLQQSVRMPRKPGPSPRRLGALRPGPPATGTDAAPSRPGGGLSTAMPRRRRASAVAAVTAARACEVREMARALDRLLGCLRHPGPGLRRQLHDHTTTVPLERDRCAVSHEKIASPAPAPHLTQRLPPHRQRSPRRARRTAALLPGRAPGAPLVAPRDAAGRRVR